MRLTDQENLAESGIDIVCSPPGKRLQNVLLLSGGEKALAAVALADGDFPLPAQPLLRAWTKWTRRSTKPTSAASRELLKRDVGATQFIVITHSKRTMEAAQAMYGVTMQEPGVSGWYRWKFGTQNEPRAAVA